MAECDAELVKVCLTTYPVAACDNGVAVIAWVHADSEGTAISPTSFPAFGPGTTYTLLDGTPYTPTGTPVAGECGARIVAEVYRIAWDQGGTTTPTLNPAGGAYVVGTTSDRVTITGPGLVSITWAWEPQTAPVADPNDATMLLDPITWVNGLAYIARVPNPLFPQIFSQSISVDSEEELVGDWYFQVDNGAYIEITVLRKV